MRLSQKGDILRRDGIGQRTTGPHIGNQNSLRRIEQLGGFRHEMHARQNDDIGIDVHGLASQRQTVAHDISHAVEDFRVW